MKKISTGDQLVQFRQEYKGVYIATKDPQSSRVLALATDYQSLEKQLAKDWIEQKTGQGKLFLWPGETADGLLTRKYRYLGFRYGLVAETILDSGVNP